MDCSRRTLPEDLCWEIAAHGDADWDVPGPSEEMLQAYRAGRLCSADEGKLEEWLAHSQATRRRLAALAGVESPPPEELRERVLAEQPRPTPAGLCAGGVVAAGSGT